MDPGHCRSECWERSTPSELPKPSTPVQQPKLKPPAPQTTPHISKLHLSTFGYPALTRAQELFMWPMQCMHMGGPGAVAKLQKQFDAGIWASTHLSGIDFGALALEHILLDMDRHVGFRPDVDGGLHLFHAAEIDSAVRSMLLGRSGACEHAHVVGDVMDRYDLTTREELRSVIGLANDAYTARSRGGENIQDITDSIAATVSTECRRILVASTLQERCWCYKHNRMCCVRDIDVAAIRRRHGLAVSISGTSCFDCSAMGRRRRTLGDSTVPFWGGGFTNVCCVKKIW